MSTMTVASTTADRLMNQAVEVAEIFVNGQKGTAVATRLVEAGFSLQIDRGGLRRVFKREQPIAVYTVEWSGVADFWFGECPPYLALAAAKAAAGIDGSAPDLS